MDSEAYRKVINYIDYTPSQIREALFWDPVVHKLPIIVNDILLPVYHCAINYYVLFSVNKIACTKIDNVTLTHKN